MSTSKSMVNFENISVDGAPINSFMRVFGDMEVKLRETEEEWDAMI